MDTLSNEEYDDLLSKNIVFLNLVDASACNTLIECVVRNTPILINRLPAVEEVLGYKYPLYYDTIEDASFLLTQENINQAHSYLVSLDKMNYTMKYFINSFEQKIKKILHI